VQTAQAAISHDAKTAAKASIKVLLASFAFLAAAIFVSHSFNAKLWLDDLFTINLMAAANLTDLWAAITSGIDANPPLYMTAAWLIVHALPRSVSWIEALTWLNVILIAAALGVLFSIGRRLVSSQASWMAVFLFATLNDGAIYLAFQLRTYALFFLITTACILFQQRLMKSHCRADLVLLGILLCLLALVHTFGIVYVLCIGLSAFVSTVHNDRTAAKLSLLAMVPAVLTFACCCRSCWCRWTCRSLTAGYRGRASLSLPEAPFHRRYPYCLVWAEWHASLGFYHGIGASKARAHVLETCAGSRRIGRLNNFALRACCYCPFRSLQSLPGRSREPCFHFSWPAISRQI